MRFTSRHSTCVTGIIDALREDIRRLAMQSNDTPTIEEAAAAAQATGGHRHGLRPAGPSQRPTGRNPRSGLSSNRRGPDQGSPQNSGCDVR